VEQLLDRIDAYCDAVPRSSARVEEFRSLVLFVPERDGWPFYARPRRGAPAPTAGEIREVRARQRELGIPESFEWIADVSPDALEPARAAGLAVAEHPVMVLRQPLAATPPEGADVRLATADDDLASIGAVAEVGFAHPGTARGEAGAEALRERAADRSAELVEFQRERSRRGLTVRAAAWVDGVPVSSGVHQPVGGVTEVAGVATLPAFRRRGFGAAVTALLVADARCRGVETVFLTAGDEEIARVYGRLGFERVGTSCIAEPA
jgi:ribosomal protein S18 acetylase RimI-like enzyme